MLPWGWGWGDVACGISTTEYFSVPCAQIENRSSTTFELFQQITKYSTSIPINWPANPGFAYSPYEGFIVPFPMGTANPSDPGFNNHAMFNYNQRFGQDRGECSPPAPLSPPFCAHRLYVGLRPR